MPRARATYHCKECRYHVKSTYRQSPHLCWKEGRRKITADRAKTSPDWCPLGHLIPGRLYPTFTPGKDPPTD